MCTPRSVFVLNKELEHAMKMLRAARFFKHDSEIEKWEKVRDSLKLEISASIQLQVAPSENL